MLRAGIFDDLKGATTLLLWGDAEGMASLLGSFKALRAAKGNGFAIYGPAGGLAIARGEGSTLTTENGVLCWQCSREMIDLAADLTASLVGQAGHQFLDLSGLAEQVMIARDQYPGDLR